MLASQQHPIVYPESDGKPMAETDVHRNLLLRMVDLLQNAFPRSYVSGNICLYYEQDNPKRMISPDALLCRSQPRDHKRVYLAWEANAQLDLVMEFSSASTKTLDHHKKKRLYAETLEVPYYVIFDPHGVYLNVFMLINGQYKPIESNDAGVFFLSDLKIGIAIEANNTLRLFDEFGKPILTSEEAQAARADQEAQRAQEARSQADQEAQRAQEAEERVKQAEQKQRDLMERIAELEQQLAQQ